MRTAKLGLSVALVGSLAVGTAGCGIFDMLNLLNAATAAAKLFGGEANTVTQSEWELLSATAANFAGTPQLALNSTEAGAVAQFLADNNITSLEGIDGTGTPTGLEDLAAAFQDRATAAGHDLSTAAGAEAFFEDYGQELADGLQSALQGMGVDLPTGGGG